MTVLTRQQYRRYRRWVSLMGLVLCTAVLGQQVSLYYQRETIRLLSEQLHQLQQTQAVQADGLDAVHDVLRALSGGKEDLRSLRARHRKTPL